MFISRLLPFVAAATAFTIFSPSDKQGSQLRLLEEPNKIPGDNPLEFCQEPAEYLLEIDNVDLDPNPPQA
jgi:hypothetical protein